MRTFSQKSTYAELRTGDPAPWFSGRTSENADFQFHTVGGRYVVLCFFGSGRNAIASRALQVARSHRLMFDDENICFFGVTLDEEDERSGLARGRPPGVRFFLDFDGNISRLYGALPRDEDVQTGSTRLRPLWIVLDPMLRVCAVFPFALDGSEAAPLFDYLAKLPSPARHAGFEVQAPVLVLPHVFEPDLCRRLIQAYDAGVHTPTGVMHQLGPMTVPVDDPGFKVRSDHSLTDEALIFATRARIQRRVVPEIARVHQFRVTRMERFIIGCYAADDGGHFRPHRDNTTKGTAHRRFAVSINLNSDFQGGQISFPEYGTQGFKPPVGGAIIFSCGLLHAVSTITSGRRYAFLPFLYDEDAAKIREDNAQFLRLRPASPHPDSPDARPRQDH